MGMIAAGMFLRLFREARDLRREDVADVLKVNFEQVGRWERGKHVPSVEHFDAYAALVKAPVTRAMELVRDKTASRVKGLREAVVVLLGDGGLTEEEIEQLRAWREIYGTQAVRDVLANMGD